MPMHDWTRVEAGIYHDFHHEWISEIKRALNRGLLPQDYYALAEQQAAGFGPDVLTLQDITGEDFASGGTATLARTKPKTTHYAQSPAEFHRRKKSSIAVRHVSGDRIVAMIEIISPGNKNNTNAFNAFIQKACELLEHRIHLLLIDPFTIKIGETLPDMPLFLAADAHILIPLEATYQAAWETMPARWQRVIAPTVG